MGGFLGALWWIVLFFCLFCVDIWGMRCLKNECYCKEELRLIDCSRANLMVIPKSVPLVNYTTLNLRHNLLVQVNFSVLKEQLPSLKMVDLRDNPFDCKGFPDKTIFGVITDCETAASVKTTTMTKANRRTSKTNPKTTRIPSSHPGTSIIIDMTVLFSSVNPKTTRIPSSHPGTTIIIYMTVLFSSVLLMPVIILCLKGVIKLCKTRHRTRTLPMPCELSLFNFDADSEEHVIFDATAL